MSWRRGVGVESNSRHLASGGDTDWKGIFNFTVRDERVVSDQRWRTDLKILGEAYSSNTDLDYNYAGGTIGPIFDISPRIAAQPFVGGGAATLGGDYYYGEGQFGVVFEGRLNGAYQSVRARGGYREYGAGFSSDNGFYADVTGKFTHPRLFSQNDLLLFEPIVRWSGVNGSGFDVTAAEVKPGRYVQWSGELSYYTPVHDWLTLGLGIRVGQIFYSFDTAPSGKKRQDLEISPDISATFRNVLEVGNDIRVDYRYEWNDSNDPSHDYSNHIGTARVIHRF